MDTKSYFEPVMALANISGSKEYPTITGRIIFKRKGEGVLVTAEIFNLPYEVGKCKHRIFGFHIHEGSSCTGNDKDPFANAGGHYNPDDCVHPMHAGDIPPLFGNNGYAYLSFYTDRFKILHLNPYSILVFIQAFCACYSRYIYFIIIQKRKNDVKHSLLNLCV